MASVGLPQFLLELTLVWTVLLACYCLLLTGSGSWRLHRRYLLLSYVAGLIVPLLPVLYRIGMETAFVVPAQVLRYVVPVTTVVPAAASGVVTHVGTNWLAIAAWVWGIGVVVSLGATVYRLALHLRPRPLQVEYDGRYRIVRSKQVRAPYAVFNRIYLPVGMAPALERIALLHETAHLRYGHTYEQLLVLLGRCVFWFHPLAWAYGYQLSKVHEYEADAEVVRTVPRQVYGKQLLTATLSHQLVPGLFSSPIGARIQMLMHALPERRLGGMHYGLLLLVAAGLLVACNLEEKEFNEAEWIAAVDAHETYQPPRLTPRFSAGDMWGTLTQKIFGEVRYPAGAREAGETGEVLLKVNVDRHGTMAYSSVPSAAAPDGELINTLPIVVVGHANTAQRKRLGTSTAGSSLATEVERMANYLVTLDWYPATDHDLPVDGSLYIYFTFKLE